MTKLADRVLNAFIGLWLSSSLTGFAAKDPKDYVPCTQESFAALAFKAPRATQALERLKQLVSNTASKKQLPGKVHPQIEVIQQWFNPTSATHESHVLTALHPLDVTEFARVLFEEKKTDIAALEFLRSYAKWLASTPDSSDKQHWFEAVLFPYEFPGIQRNLKERGKKGSREALATGKTMIEPIQFLDQNLELVFEGVLAAGPKAFAGENAITFLTQARKHWDSLRLVEKYLLEDLEIAASQVEGQGAPSPDRIKVRERGRQTITRLLSSQNLQDSLTLKRLRRPGAVAAHGWDTPLVERLLNTYTSSKNSSLLDCLIAAYEANKSPAVHQKLDEFMMSVDTPESHQEIIANSLFAEDLPKSRKNLSGNLSQVAEGLQFIVNPHFSNRHQWQPEIAEEFVAAYGRVVGSPEEGGVLHQIKHALRETRGKAEETQLAEILVRAYQHSNSPNLGELLMNLGADPLAHEKSRKMIEAIF